MNILAFDTSSIACGVVLQCGDKTKAMQQVAPMQQARLILPMIKELLQNFSCTLTDLDAVAFCSGPGSFTGIRIASSVVQGLGFAMKMQGKQLPILCVSSLAALAQSLYMKNKWSKCLVALDARMKQIYWAQYQVNRDDLVELMGEEKRCYPNEVNLPQGSWYGIGDGFKVYHKELISQSKTQFLDFDTVSYPSPLAILQLAKQKFLLKEWLTPEQATPYYLGG